MKKRNDLQWLRAVAIISVVAFHLEPKLFPFGYLGVDVFFVLSGYLMTTILSKSNIPILKFYGSRVKRIFPAFVFVIAAVMGISFFILLPSDYDFLKTEAIWSIFFVNNLYPIFHQKQYFEMLSEFKFLVHTWSLGVELQFYLVAPFLIRFLLSRKRPIAWVASVSIFSFLAQISSKSESFAFGFVFCRIWQFLAGTLAFCFHPMIRSCVSQNKQSIYKNCVFVFLGIVCFYSFAINKSKTRIISQMLSSFFSAIFIALDKQHLGKKSIFYIDSVFIYIGDASYVIYLVHWPTIIYFKYFESQYGNASIIFVISAISFLLYHCFEIPLLKRRETEIYSFILIFYTVIICYCLINSKASISSIIAENEKEAESCKELYYACESDPLMEEFYQIKTRWNFPAKFCIYKLNPSSNRTLMIAGNSFAYFQNRGMIEAIKEAKTQFSKIYFTTISGCNLIVGKFNEKYICENFYEIFYRILNVTRPDVIVVSARIDLFLPFNASPITETDKYLMEFRKNIMKSSEFTQRFIILEPNPVFDSTRFKKIIFNPLKVAQTLRIGKSVITSNVTLEHFHQIHDPSWNRVKKAVEHCSNCILVPTQHLFCQDGICPMVDPKTQLSMYCDDNHITPRKSLALKTNLKIAIDEHNPDFNK